MTNLASPATEPTACHSAPTVSSSHLMTTYARQPIAFVRGEGSFLYTADGTAYLDALSGIAVCGLGHAHPAVSAAIADQAATLVHTSNLYQVPWQEAAGALLCDVGGMDNCFFSNSGAEANEAAIKLARLHGHNKGIADPQIIVMEKSFHGRTLATLSATGNIKVQKGFEPLVSGFLRVPFGDVAAIRALAATHPNIVAILVEPIQGEGGINTAPQGFSYLEELRALCDIHDWLLMLDEIQTGNGRTGKYFAYQHTGITPDVLTTAKGLGNGFPVGACLAHGKAASLFHPGNHGSTYGGTPLACRTVHTVIRTLVEDGVIANAETVGAYLVDSLKAQLQGTGAKVRGFGLMIGIELPVTSCAELVAQARNEQQLIINVTADNVVRLLPALTLNQQEADQIVERLVPLIRRLLDQNPS